MDWGSLEREAGVRLCRVCQARLKKNVRMPDFILKPDKYWVFKTFYFLYPYPLLLIPWMSLFILPQINDGQKSDGDTLLWNCEFA